MSALGVAAGVVGVFATARAASPKIVRILDRLGLFAFLHEDLGTTEERFYLVEESFDDAEFDIVVIHDVQNSRPARQPSNAENDETVRQLRNKVKETEKVRILAYHYDTTLRSSEFLTRRTLLHEAVQLTTRLVRARANVKHEDRPIIFVAYSMGGILLKSALNLSGSSKKDDERSILVSTVGCLYFNTPHKESPDELSEAFWNIVRPKLDTLQVQSHVWQRQEFLYWARRLVVQAKRFDVLTTAMPRQQYIEREFFGDKETVSFIHISVLEFLQAVRGDLRHGSRFKSGNTVVPSTRSGKFATETEFRLGGRVQTSDMDLHMQPSNPPATERDISVSHSCFETTKQGDVVTMLGPEGPRGMLHEKTQSSPELLVPTTLENPCSLFEMKEPCCSPPRTKILQTKDIDASLASSEAKETHQLLSEIPSTSTSFIPDLDRGTYCLYYGSSMHTIEGYHCIDSRARWGGSSNTYSYTNGKFSNPQDRSSSVSGYNIISGGRIRAEHGNVEQKKELSISSSSLEERNLNSSFCVLGRKWDTSLEREVHTTTSSDERASRQLDTNNVNLSKETRSVHRCPNKTFLDDTYSGAQFAQNQRTTSCLKKPLLFKILEKLGFSRAETNKSHV